MSPTPPRVLVVGGGITGLCAGWEAARAGAQVSLVEAGPSVGGKIRTEAVDGLLIEHGPDSFVAYRPAALALVDELGLSDQIISVNPNREVSLRVDGRLRPIPAGMGMVLPTRLGPFATTRILTARQKARAGLDLVLPRRLTDEDVAIGQFLRARLGDGVTQRFAEPLVGGIYGAGVDQLSLDAVLPSLRESERRYRSLMLASLAQGRAARSAQSGGGARSPFRTLRDGLGTLVDQVADRLTGLGGALRTGTEVISLERDGTQTRARLSDGSTVEADAVVLAVGAPTQAKLLEPWAPRAAAALRSIPQSSTTVVTLALPMSGFARRPSTQGWLEVGPAPISGVTVSSAKWAGRAPQDVLLLRAFVPERLGPLAHATDDAILAEVGAHVAAVMGFRGEPSTTRITRWVGVMPTYTVGHLARVAEVDRALAELPGWWAAGSALHGVGVPECVADGRRVGRLAAGAPTPTRA